MAARENQGLQIALIIFVMLTILTVVSTYWFFSRWQEQLAKTKAATESTATAITDKEKAVKEKGDLLAFFGAAATDAVADVIAAAKAKIDSYAQFGFAQLPEDQRTFPKVIEGLVSTIKTANTTVAETKATMAKDKADFDANLAKAVANTAEVTTSRDATVAQLAEQTKKYNDAVIELNKSKDLLAADKNDINKSLDALKAKYQADTSALGIRIAELTKENIKLKLAVDTYSNRPNPMTSGGTILWVNQRDNVVFLSLGSDDSLQRKTTFNVYPQGTTNVNNAVPKGKIEVTNITGTHTSEARIVENAISDPLLPGDLVHTVEWAPGQHPHYAIGGLVDLNGSGSDQTHKLREMIEATGGVVDAEVVTTKGDGGLVGRVKGAITINTRYLILGDPKADTPEGLARLPATTTLITEANRLHVEQIGLNKFLSMMGYVAPVGVGPGAAGATIQGTIKGVPNNAFQNSFRPRQPGAAAANAGANP